MKTTLENCSFRFSPSFLVLIYDSPNTSDVSRCPADVIIVSKTYFASDKLDFPLGNPFLLGKPASSREKFTLSDQPNFLADYKGLFEKRTFSLALVSFLSDKVGFSQRKSPLPEKLTGK